MGMQTIVLRGGVDLTTAKYEAAPGSLRDCLNFEVANRDGYTKIRGIKAYSGGVANDVIDPYVLHSYPEQAGFSMDTLTSNFIDGSQSGIIKWGSGGDFDAKNESLTSNGGYASVCWSRYQGPTLAAIAFTNVYGRMPLPGDTITYITFTARVYKPPLRASELVADGSMSIFGSAYLPWTGIGPATQLIHDFDMPPVTGAIAGNAYSISSSPLGGNRGLFYFEDKLHVIADIEAFTFTGGNKEPDPGNNFDVFYEDTFPVGLSTRYVVESVVTTSGAWDAGTAAGVICMIREAGLQSVVAPTMMRGGSPVTINPVTLGVQINSKLATMWREVGADVFNSYAGQPYERCDLGHEIRFNTGTNYPTVLNRANRNADLELAVSSTDWLPCGNATGWGFPSSSAQGPTDGIFATQGNSIAAYSPPLVCTDFGASLPANAVVLGIEMRFTRRKAASGSISCQDREIILAGVQGVSQNKRQAGFWPTTSAPSLFYGGPNDAWGSSLTASIVNSTDFGVSIAAESVNGSGGNNREIDSVEIKITYKDRSSVLYFGDGVVTAVTSITKAGTLATVTTTGNHGFVGGESVTHYGASDPLYNITAAITVTGLNTYTYTLASSPAANAVGTLTAIRNYSTGRLIWYHKKSGDWSTTDAVGTFTMYELSAPSRIRAGQVIRTAPGNGGSVVATVASAPEKMYLPSSSQLDANRSQWETCQGNFFSSIGTEQTFMVSGADFGASWDGNYFIRFRTGVEEAEDKPRHVVKHLDQLLLGYPQGSVIASDAGYPESYAAIVGGTSGASSPISDDPSYLFAGGAQAVAMGDSVYGLVSQDGQRVFVGCRNSKRQILGTVGSLIQAVIDPSMGIIEYTLKDMGQPVYTDWQAIRLGDGTELSKGVSSWLNARTQQDGAGGDLRGPLRAEIIRSKRQYRLYFRDGYVLTTTLRNGPEPTFQKLPFAPASTCTGVTSSGKDMLFVSPYGIAQQGPTNNYMATAYRETGTVLPSLNLYVPNYVYQGDVGTSWDDQLAIDAFIELNATASGKESEVKYFDRMLTSGLCYGAAPFGANFGVNFGDIETGTPTNIGGGSVLASPDKAFSEQYFSTMSHVGRNGYALGIKFWAGNGSLYGFTSTQSTPYKFREVTLQSVALFIEAQKYRR